MATFVSNNTRAFKAPGDPCELPLNSKSIFHMKTYQSATDPRAWAYGSNDRKQYILEMFAADTPETPNMGVGKYVNMNALMRTLMSNKDADIMYLQSQLKLLEAFLDDLGLSDEQRSTLESLKQNPNDRLMKRAPLLLTRSSSIEMIPIRSSEETITPNYSEIIEELNRKYQDQEYELEQQRAIAQDAMQKLSSFNVLEEERNYLKQENFKLLKSLDSIRNTKASSNNDLLLKAQINELKCQIRRNQARKLSSLKMVRSDQIAIFPEPPLSTREVCATTSENYMDVKQIIEERNNLQETVGKLLTQMENLQKFDEIIERQLPGRHDRCPGDHASQVCQTIPNLQVEVELRKEVEYLRGKLGEFEIKKLEFDRLCLHISELQLVQKEHEDMKMKYHIQFLEQRTSITHNLNKIDCLKEQCSSLNAELERYKKYEDENNLLSNRCKNLQNIIENQQGKVRFLENCKSLVVDSESKINALKEELDKKASIIKVSEDKLLTLQTQLRDSINTLTSETTVLKTSLQDAHGRIEGLLEQENMNQLLIKQLEDELSAKDMLLQSYAQGMPKNAPKALQERDNIIEQLRKKLIDLQQDNEKLGDLSSRLHGYITNKTLSSTSIVKDGNVSSGSRRINCKTVDNIFQALRQLQNDFAQANMSCDATAFYRLKERYRDLQSLAKGQVHWLATGLRKCKEEVQSLQCRFQEKE